jgi:hypothetical protein
MYDPGTHQVLIEGGDYWTPSAPPSPVPCSRVVRGPKNFADGCSVGTVSTGRNYDDTWAWDGADWHQLHSAYAPKVVSPWVGGGYFYDGLRHRLIADFGGPYPAMAGLYSWDGRTWTRVRPKNEQGVEASQPGFPSDVIAVDPVAGTVVVYTGQRASDCQGQLGLACFSAVSETLVGDGLSWSKLAGPEPEPERGKLISDPVDGSVLLLNELGHTWVLRNGHWYRAATDGPHPSIHGGFLYTDGMAVYFQPELGVRGSRWSWDGQHWRTVG